jgi:adenosylmethionine---8-amino-7-oxononanoate aminotransferase
MKSLGQLDQRYVWHPFTQMRDWLKREPIVIVSGQGAVLRDANGKQYLDANSSMWTNLHGHNHPKLNTAIQRQLGKIAHSSALGLANEPASLLAKELVAAANPGAKGKFAPVQQSHAAKNKSAAPECQPCLNKVFYSDDGSTAIEAAVKLAYEFARRTGRARQPEFLSLAGAYHGDTIGAVSVGKIDLFHKSYARLLFKTDTVVAPYCYRCRFNRAKPDRDDARRYRQCNWECIGIIEKKFATRRKRSNRYAAMIVEPLIQGAAGMIPQPEGWLRRVAEIVRADGAQLIADEVLTGFGRTGASPLTADAARFNAASKTPIALFACHQENVQPDFLALAKGMSGGYLPMAATLTTQAVFDAFLGDYSEFKTFFHGHSYTGNQLGSAAALTSLELLQTASSIRARIGLEGAMKSCLEKLWARRHVGDIRRVGLIAGIELVKDWRTRQPFDLRERAGIRVCAAMATRGVLTRPIGNVVVVMPPYCTTPEQVERICVALDTSIQEILGR